MQEKLFTKGFSQTELYEHAKDFLQSPLNKWDWGEAEGNFKMGK